jgi:hypothetical protein
MHEEIAHVRKHNWMREEGRETDIRKEREEKTGEAKKKTESKRRFNS